MKRLLLLLLATLATASAQIDVRVEMKRRMFIRGESIEATLTMRNLTGHDVTLRDADGQPWFGFQVIEGRDTPIAPFTTTYKNEPLTILAGDSVSRTVDLSRLYPVNELTTYRVRGAIYFHEMQKFMISDESMLDISEGKRVWGQTVGVPSGKEGAGEYRDVAILTFQTGKDLSVYARVSDLGSGAILCTYPLGRVVGGAIPMGEFDNDNTLYAFHLVAQNQYALSKISVNGEWLGQTMWNSAKGRAGVRKKPDGTMVVVGATKGPVPGTVAAGSPPVPKVSDRPVALPK